MEKPRSDRAAFLSEDGQTGFDLGEDSLDAATRWNVKIAAHSSSYICELRLHQWKKRTRQSTNDELKCSVKSPKAEHSESL